MQRKKPLLPLKVMGSHPQPSRGVGTAPPTAELQQVALHSSGSAFSLPEGSFYSQGFWSKFYPCEACSVPGDRAASAGDDVWICLRGREDGFWRAAGLVMRLLWFHRGSPEIQVWSIKDASSSPASFSASLKSGGRTHFDISLRSQLKFNASFSTATRTRDMVLTRATWPVETDRMIYFGNLSYRGGYIYKTLGSFVLFLLFFNTTLWNAFSLFAQLASIWQAFGKNSQLYVVCHKIWYTILSFLWPLIKSLDSVFVVEVLSLLRSDLFLGEE